MVTDHNVHHAYKYLVLTLSYATSVCVRLLDIYHHTRVHGPFRFPGKIVTVDIPYNVECLLSYKHPRLSTSRNTPNKYRGADMSLARPTSPCILFDGENVSFDASLVLYTHTYIYIHIYIYI